jgi:hypothetical protein
MALFLHDPQYEFLLLLYRPAAINQTAHNHFVACLDPRSVQLSTSAPHLGIAITSTRELD